MPLHLRTLAIVVVFAGFQCIAGYIGPALATDDQGSQEVLWPTKSWPVSTPEEQGMDSASLARLIETVGIYKQDSLTIIRHGKIVADAYYAPYIAGVSHDLRSVTKSVVGTLTAILLQKGSLDSVDHPVMDLFSDKEIRWADDRKRAMTVQNLLDMTSGIEWVEKAYTPDETIMKMSRSPDRTAFVLSQPMVGAPGAIFNYNGGNPYLLSALITERSGQNAFDFAKKELFEPLGIKSAKWGSIDAQGVTNGAAGLFLSPHDMARIGYLYLHNGMWDGRQIIPSSWVDRSMAGPVKATSGFHYGNLWWSYPDKGAYLARGRHSQLILVLPELDVVAVMTGILPDNDYSASRLIDDIFNAVKSDGPLPADPTATALLTNAIGQAATEKPSNELDLSSKLIDDICNAVVSYERLPADPIAKSRLNIAIRQAAKEKPSAVGGTPELAKAVSGKVYEFADNVLHVKAFTLNFLDSDSSWVRTTDTGQADRPTDQVAVLVGLDGTYRRSPPAPYGINAARGRWISEHTFAIERRILGRGETEAWALTFYGDKVTVNFENTDGFKAELHGERSE
jgi:CubicO group peptidase (beta-lactamase class C family)